MDFHDVHACGTGANVVNQILHKHGRFGVDKTQRNEFRDSAGFLLDIPEQSKMPG